MDEPTTITIRSKSSETRTVPLIEDACQICYLIGMVAHLEVEDWRLCVDCLPRYLSWNIASYPIPQRARHLSDPDDVTLLSPPEQRLGLTPPERTIIRHAVTDHASTTHGYILGFGKPGLVSYVAHTYVYPAISELRDRREQQKLPIEDLITVTELEIDRQHHTPSAPFDLEVFKNRIERRMTLATQLINTAMEALKTEDFLLAAALINLAEATAPSADIESGYDHFRSLISPMSALTQFYHILRKYT